MREIFHFFAAVFFSGCPRLPDLAFFSARICDDDKLSRDGSHDRLMRLSGLAETISEAASSPVRVPNSGISAISVEPATGSMPGTESKMRAVSERRRSLSNRREIRISITPTNRLRCRAITGSECGRRKERRPKAVYASPGIMPRFLAHATQDTCLRSGLPGP